MQNPRATIQKRWSKCNNLKATKGRNIKVTLKLWKDWPAEHLDLLESPWGRCSTRPHSPLSWKQHQYVEFEGRRPSDFCVAVQGSLSQDWTAGKQVLLALFPCLYSWEMGSQYQQEAKLQRLRGQKVLRGQKQDQSSVGAAAAECL